MQDKSVKTLLAICDEFASELDTSVLDIYLATHEGRTAKEIKKILLYNIKCLKEFSEQVKEQVEALE